MTEMVERVARAISVAVLGVDTEWRNSIGLARAAISSMREPTKNMHDATYADDVFNHWFGEYIGDDPQGAIWRAMIDAALK